MLDKHKLKVGDIIRNRVNKDLYRVYSTAGGEIWIRSVADGICSKLCVPNFWDLYESADNAEPVLAMSDNPLFAAQHALIKRQAEYIAELEAALIESKDGLNQIGFVAVRKSDGAKFLSFGKSSDYMNRVNDSGYKVRPIFARSDV